MSNALSFKPKYHRQITEGDNQGAWTTIGARPQGALSMGRTRPPGKIDVGAELAFAAAQEGVRIEGEGFKVCTLDKLC